MNSVTCNIWRSDSFGNCKYRMNTFIVFHDKLTWDEYKGMDVPIVNHQNFYIKDKEKLIQQINLIRSALTDKKYALLNITHGDKWIRDLCKMFLKGEEFELIYMFGGTKMLMDELLFSIKTF